MAVDLSFSGLASGFDWKTFVNNVMATQTAPIDAIKKQQTTNTNKVSALASLQSLITTLQGASTAMSAPDLFAGRSVTSSTTSSTWAPVAAIGAAKGSYDLKVSQLASAAAINGVSGVGSSLSPTDDVTGLTVANLPTAATVTAGTFTVNGKQVNIALTDSLDQVFQNISTATGGTVTAAYDHTTDQITLSSGSEIVLGAANDTSSFLTAMKLANNGTNTIASSGTLGVMNPALTLANARLKAPITAVDASGNGSFTVNGVNITYNVNNDTLAGLLTKINQSGAGVTAAYDPSNDRVTLTNNVTGDLGMSVSEASGGLMDALGLSTAAGGTIARGTNAQFSINGGPTRSSTTNLLTSAALGVPGLSATVNTKDTQTLTVTDNTTAMSTAINNFISAYNSVQSFLDTNTAITNTNGTISAGVLADNRDVQDWGTTMRSKIFNAVPGLTGSIKQLSDLGIDFTPGTSQLDITDTTKFNTALANNPDDVAAFFQTTTTGLSSQFSAYTAKLLTADTQQQATLTKTNSDLDTQIANIQRQLDQQRATLTASFVAMETAQSQIQTQQQALNSAFGTSSSSSSSSSSGKLTSS